MLISDEIFAEFLQDGDFRLYIGLDSITDVAAIQMLESLATEHPRLNVRAFLNPSSSLFHPKMAWFEFDEHMTLIVGSGNLTLGGLKSNWEAFTVTKLYGEERVAILEKIEGWLTDRSADLLPLSDSRVVERAGQNTGSERDLKHGGADQPSTITIANETDAVFIAEIPRAGTRWSQANFDREHFEGFFGAAVGTPRRIVLYHVSEDGSLGTVESRPSVEVASENYRFELAAAKGVTYPTAGRPIGVFLRLNTGEFLYTLLLPGEAGYADVDAFLAASWSGAQNRVRRASVSVAELQTVWPSSPFWNAQLPAL
jgi:hypothetical protein